MTLNKLNFVNDKFLSNLKFLHQLHHDNVNEQINENEIYIYVILEINFEYILVLVIVTCRTSLFF